MLRPAVKRSTKGFTLIEMVITVALLAIATASTVPIITRILAQGEVDRYRQQIETGLFSLKAKLSAKKTSCPVEFASTFKFEEPKNIIEFSQNSATNQTTFECCDSEIDQLLANDGCVTTLQPGHKISDLTNNPLDNLRLVSLESTPESKRVRIAIAGPSKSFGFTPAGTTSNASSLTFLVCHEQSLDADDPFNCAPERNNISMRCLSINGTGGIKHGTWKVPSAASPVSSGSCDFS